MKTIAFFNNKGGVGKTSLVYHLAWTFADQGRRVIAADLDPQANLTASFLDEDRLEELWTEDNRSRTVYGALRPLIEGTGDVASPWIEEIDENLGLVAGDLTLARFEDQLSIAWPQCSDRQPRAFREISAFWRMLHQASDQFDAEFVLIDVGPNLGAINRTAMVASDYVVVPLSPDLYSLQGLRNLGPSLAEWRAGWLDRLSRTPDNLSIRLPMGGMEPAGYIVLQHAVRLDRPVKAYNRWIARIPAEYRKSMLLQEGAGAPPVDTDPHCLALLKHYRSLMPLAQEARKPMFHLKAADGALGAHAQAAIQAGEDFRKLAAQISNQVSLLV